LKYKARWVAHGYKQSHGIDFDDTFAAIVKPISYKTLMAISTKRGLHIRQMDVVTAFLYGFLDETVYVVQPIMYETGDEVCKLRKALYELKQSPKVWYDTIHDYLKKLGFKRTESDHGVFISPETGVILAVYVDDLLIFGSDIKDIRCIQNELSSRFQMTDLRELSHYLGMEITISSDRDVITLRQRTYMKKILTQFGMIGCNPVSTPMKAGVANSLMPADKMADPLTIK
jgi:hypothetical protein